MYVSFDCPKLNNLTLAGWGRRGAALRLRRQVQGEPEGAPVARPLTVAAAARAAGGRRQAKNLCSFRRRRQSKEEGRKGARSRQRSNHAPAAATCQKPGLLM